MPYKDKLFLSSICVIYRERLKSHLQLLSHITYLLFSLQLQYFHSFQAHAQTKKKKISTRKLLADGNQIKS